MFNYNDYVERFGQEAADRVKKELEEVTYISKWKIHVEHVSGMNYIFIATNIDVTIITERDKKLHSVTHFSYVQAKKGLELMNELKEVQPCFGT